MKFYDPVDLSKDQKKELCFLIGDTNKKDIVMHEWLLGDPNTFELIYVKPADRKYHTVNGGRVTTTKAITVVDVWGLLALLDLHIPVDGFALISRLNAIAERMDVIYKDKK